MLTMTVMHSPDERATLAIGTSATPEAITNYVIEVVDRVPYSEEGIRAVPLLGGMVTADPLGWMTPDALSSTDGSLWLHAEKGLFRVADRQIVPRPITESEGLSVLQTLLLHDGFLIAVQHTDTQEGALYRFDANQQLLWTRPFMLGYNAMTSPHIRLFHDQNGRTYLYTGLHGEVLQVDVANGSLELRYRFDESPLPPEIWALNQKLYWYQYHPDERGRSWNEYNLTSQMHRSVHDSPLEGVAKIMVWRQDIG